MGMQSTGIVRKVDSLGRIVIPMELRNSLDIKEKDALEIFTEGDRIILRKYEPYCVFCGEVDDVINFNSRNVCRKCISELSKNKF